MSHNEIVVGIDGSRAAEQALLWAAAEAQRRGVTLRIAHAGDCAPGLDDSDDEKPTAFGHALLVDASATVFDAGIDCDIRTTIDQQPAHRLLSELGEHADLLVVGSHGLGRAGASLLGSVAFRVAADSRCPVAVIRQSPDRIADSDALPISVGVSTSPGGQPAMDFAFAEAALRGVALEAVHSWSEIDWADSTSALLYNSQTKFRARQRELVEALLAPLAARYPDVPVTVRDTGDSVAAALRQASEHSGLLVLGCHRNSGALLSRLGPTSARLLHIARCPVIVVGREPADREPTVREPVGREPVVREPVVGEAAAGSADTPLSASRA